MRATEALHLSNPETDLDMETAHLCSHFDVARNMRNRELIKAARKENARLSKEENKQARLKRERPGMLF